MSDFHFSPRPNRAHEIAWNAWSDAVFARAAAEDKPILLSISAVWCHWCHVMDETSYSDPGVIAAINDAFVPVRVDNDERPDVNARYNMGGWPTTAFLTPDGSILTGATYLPPAQMRRATEEIASYYRAKKTEIAARADEMRGATAQYALAPVDTLNASLLERFTGNVMSDYDSEYGGFGDEPKFPQTELLDYLVTRWRMTNDVTLYNAVSQTMREMSAGGMYDHVEGGYFRYSTTRDWSVPHFEKMAEDHGGLLRVLAQLEITAPSDQWRTDLTRTIGYLRTVLLDPSTQLFAGSQDADETYFALPAQDRAQRIVPFVDRRSYTNWTAGLAGAFAWCGLALGDESLSAQARATLDALHERARDEDGLLYHVLAPGEAPRVRGLLGDQVAYIRALIDTYESGGEQVLLERAIAHANVTLRDFGAEDGGFYDRLDREAIGRLDRRDRPLGENGVMAENLLRLSALTHDPQWRASAERTLVLYAATFERARSFAAPYAKALARYLEPEVNVRLAQPRFRRAARALPTPFAVIETDRGAGDRAFVCVGTACAAPVEDPSALAGAFTSVA